MEFSLQHWNQNTKLKNLTISEVTNLLNLIGLEVDNISIEQDQSNLFLENIRLLIKISANREDLLNESIFLNELRTIFTLDLFEVWNNSKKNYCSLLLEEYQYIYNLHFDEYLFKTIKVSLPIYINEKQFSAKWVQKKLILNEISIDNNIFDYFRLISLEWGHKFELVSEKFGKILSSNLVSGNYIIECTYDKESRSKIDRKAFLETFRMAIQRLITLLDISNLIELKKQKKLLQIVKNSETNLKLKITKIIRVKKLLAKKLLNLNNFNEKIFEKAGLNIICKTNNYLYFSISNFRRDLNREVDIIEEYCRFLGYLNFSEIKPLKSLSFYKNKKKIRSFIKQFFFNNSFNEIITNPLESNNEAFNSLILLQNPLNLELSYLRQTLLLQLIEIFSRNFRQKSDSTNYFEIGRTFKKENNKNHETDKLGGIFQLKLIKKNLNSSDEWFKAKGYIENFFKNFSFMINQSSASDVQIPVYFHKTRVVSFFIKNQLIGFFGELNPIFQNSLNSKYSTYIFEFNLELLDIFEINSFIPTYKEIIRYPIIKKDISFLISKDINYLLIKESILDVSLLIKKIIFFDIYFDEKDPRNVSLGIHLEFQSEKGTLTNDQIDEEILQIKTILVEKFNVSFKI